MSVMWAQRMNDVVRNDDLTLEQKVALIDQHRAELERRVELIEALIDAVRTRDAEVEYP